MSTEQSEQSEPITAFRNAFDFLSNFHPHPVRLDDETYPTNEHAFQAMKTLDPEERRKVRDALNPAAAKRLGKKVTLREGWDELRFTVMDSVGRAKFADPNLAAKLLATGDFVFIDW